MKGCGHSRELSQNLLPCPHADVILAVCCHQRLEPASHEYPWPLQPYGVTAVRRCWARSSRSSQQGWDLSEVSQVPRVGAWERVPASVLCLLKSSFPFRVSSGPLTRFTLSRPWQPISGSHSSLFQRVQRPPPSNCPPRTKREALWEDPRNERKEEMGATLWAGGSFIPQSPSCPRITRSIKTETILCFKSSNLLSKIHPPTKHWKYKQKLLETWCQKFTRILCDKRPRDSNILAIHMKGNTIGQLKKK